MGFSAIARGDNAQQLGTRIVSWFGGGYFRRICPNAGRNASGDRTSHWLVSSDLYIKLPTSTSIEGVVDMCGIDVTARIRKGGEPFGSPTQVNT